MTGDYTSMTAAMRQFYESRHTFAKEFRIAQLRKLKNAILENEQRIYDALKNDLNKPPEEAWVTEIGFVLGEIRHAISGLGKWMHREKVSTNLLNFPSKSYIYKEPLGVVLIIGPWNYPFQLLMAPLVGAIAAGNTAIVKPSELAPATSGLISDIIRKIFQPEYIRCIEGDGAIIVPELMNSFRFDHVFYTGSTTVGKKVYRQAAEKLVPVTLELGGKSPCVIEKDANIKVAARRIALTKFSNAGQMCVAPDYLLVHEAVHDDLVEELRKCIVEFYNAETNGSDYGRIVNHQALKRLSGYLENARVVAGGVIDQEKSLIGPTVVTDVTAESPVMKEEIFGPILPVITYKDYGEAKSIIEKNPNPLAFYLFTENKDNEKRWLRDVSFGGGCVNNAAWHLTNPNLPFGGRGDSGIGAYHGKFSFDVFTHRKAVMITPTWFDPKIKYPPFKGKLSFFKKFIRR